MISAILIILGLTLIYTAWLIFDRDMIWAGVTALAGLILLVRPALYVFYLVVSRLDQRPRSGGPKSSSGGGKGKRTHLRVVHSKEDKPTIH